jgi:hypothetical protein
MESDAVAAEELMLDVLKRELPTLERARFLPTLIDAQIALGKWEDAGRSLHEFTEIAHLCQSTAMRSEAADRSAAIAAAEGRAQEAISELQAAVRGWSKLQMPFELAQSRLRLGELLRASGREAAATMEVDAARSTLDRFGVAEG